LAEARDRFQTNSPWWLDSKELNERAEEEQADRCEEDPFLDQYEGLLPESLLLFDLREIQDWSHDNASKAQFQKAFFVNSWHRFTVEITRMWEEYAKVRRRGHVPVQPVEGGSTRLSRPRFLDWCSTIRTKAQVDTFCASLAPSDTCTPTSKKSARCCR
jgi:hypothetical protein